MSEATAAPAPAATSLMGGEPAAAPAAAAAAPAAAATPAAAPAATPAPTAAPAAEPTEAEKAAAAAKAAAEKPAGAPEKYEDFKLPDTLKASPVMTEFATLAKDLNLPQESAQKVVDLAAKMQQGTAEQLTAAVEAQAEKWGTDSKADKEFGGDKFDENLAVAKTALDKFGTPELKTLLNESKLGNHPEVLRFFFRAGKAISQDGFVPGRAGGERPSHAEVLYKH